MKKLLTLCLVFASLTGKGQTKITHEENAILTKDKTLEKLDAYAPDNAVIVFTTGYLGDQIHITAGNKFIYKSATSAPAKRIASIEITPNDADITVKFFRNGRNHEVTLHKTDLKKYKYVYISKDVMTDYKDMIITYSNETKYSF